MNLRDYQWEAVNKLIWAQSLTGNDLCVLPTGAGKSLVIAELARRINKDILILQPGKEILTQNYEKLCQYVDKREIGIYSASMEEKTIGRYTLATIQSIYQKPQLFAHFRTIIIDECHLVNPKNLEGMFTSFLREIGNPKVIGLTATPYRLFQAYKPAPESYYNFIAYTTNKLIMRIKERFWSRVVYSINPGDLVQQDYLVPLQYIDSTILRQEDIPVNASRSDFDLSAYSEHLKTTQSENQIANVLDFCRKTHASTLVFFPEVAMAQEWATKIPGAVSISAKTKKKDRTAIVEGFKNGTIPMVCNVGVLTTGFDHPGLDCIVLIRPTQSLSLYYQMLGRGVRKAPGKTYCQVIDLSGTVKRMGPIESIRLTKEDGLWELKTATGNWHNKELYSIELPKK